MSVLTSHRLQTRRRHGAGSDCEQNPIGAMLRARRTQAGVTKDRYIFIRVSFTERDDVFQTSSESLGHLVACGAAPVAGSETGLQAYNGIFNLRNDKEKQYKVLVITLFLYIL